VGFRTQAAFVASASPIIAGHADDILFQEIDRGSQQEDVLHRERDVARYIRTRLDGNESVTPLIYCPNANALF